MRVLVTGANGMLAKEVISVFSGHDLIKTDIAGDGIERLDITRPGDVTAFVSVKSPDVIINCAAYTAVDKAEEETGLCRAINTGGSVNLAAAAKARGIPLVHISTDYVFDGEKPLDEVYTEEDNTNPQSVYGLTKRDGEHGIIAQGGDYWILRTSWLYGDGGNFVRTMLKLGSEKDELNVVADQFGSPTYSADLACIIKQVIDKKADYGVYHANNLGFTSWYEFTKQIFYMAGLNCKVNPVTTEEFPRPAKRPKNSKLSKDKLLNAGIKIPEYTDALSRYLERELLL